MEIGRKDSIPRDAYFLSVFVVVMLLFTPLLLISVSKVDNRADSRARTGSGGGSHGSGYYGDSGYCGGADCGGGDGGD